MRVRLACYNLIVMVLGAVVAAGELRADDAWEGKLRRALDVKSDAVAMLQHQYDAAVKNRKEVSTKDIAELRKMLDAEKARHHKLRSDCLASLNEAKRKRNINAQDAQGRTLLMVVASAGNDEATRAVLSGGAKLSILDKRGKSAYDYERDGRLGKALDAHMRAEWSRVVEAEDVEEMKELLNAGADPRWLVGDPSENPLCRAVRMNQESVISVILTYMMDLDGVTTADGKPPVELAMESQNARIVEMLSKVGCRPSLRFSDGRTILEHLIEPSAVRMLDAWLMGGVGIEDRVMTMCSAVRYGSHQAVQTACTHLKDVLNREDSYGNMPLHEAARRGDVGIYKLLVERGADVRACNVRGETLLMHAALSGQMPMLETALAALSADDVVAVDKAGHTAVYYAELAKDTAAVERLKRAMKEAGQR